MPYTPPFDLIFSPFFSLNMIFLDEFAHYIYLVSGFGFEMIVFNHVILHSAKKTFIWPGDILFSNFPFFLLFNLSFECIRIHADILTTPPPHKKYPPEPHSHPPSFFPYYDHKLCLLLCDKTLSGSL